METLQRLNDEVCKFSSHFNKQMTKFTLKTDFEKLSLDHVERCRYLKTCAKDLNNKLKTTDRYID